MSRTKPSRFQQIAVILFVAYAIQILLGDAIGGFMDGMIIGFTDEI